MKDLLDELDQWLTANWSPDSSSANGGSDSASPGGRRRRCRPTPTAVTYRATKPSRSRRRSPSTGTSNAPGVSGCCSPLTIATHGSQEQIEQYVKPIVTGAQGWCQLFSQLGAGSDLAGLGTRRRP
ncbi:MAG: hypothetical protein R2713_01150 [Ilumatobacteraceae bacterium]